MLRQNLNNIENYSILGFDYKKALNILEQEKSLFNIIFIDPPYELYDNLDINELIFRCDKVLGKEGIIIMEHSNKTIIDTKGFNIKTKKYGGTLVSFIRRDN